MTKQELRNAIDEAKTIEEVEALEKEIENVEAEEVVADEVAEEAKTEEAVEEKEEAAEEVDAKEEVVEITADEERSLLRDVVEERKNNILMEVSKMEERNYNFEKEYRSAWAKSLMGVPKERLSENEQRALGDAVVTTATTFVESDADTQGINNGGLFIPASVREELMERLEKQSPIFRDIRKLAVAGNVELPYIHESDDASWTVELTSTVNEGIEFKSVKLTGHELVKNIDITWKAEKMTIDSFIDYLLDEIEEKMGATLINAVIYGNGSGKATGITNGLSPVTTGSTIMDVIINTAKSLAADARIGAKVYVSSDADLEIVGYKDDNGNYPFLAGVAALKGLSIEADPYLKDNDVIVGNMRNYVLNEVSPFEVIRGVDNRTRKVSYTGYAIYDGAPKAGKFAYGQFEETSI